MAFNYARTIDLFEAAVYYALQNIKTKMVRDDDGNLVELQTLLRYPENVGTHIPVTFDNDSNNKQVKAAQQNDQYWARCSVREPDGSQQTVGVRDARHRNYAVCYIQLFAPGNVGRLDSARIIGYLADTIKRESKDWARIETRTPSTAENYPGEAEQYWMTLLRIPFRVDYIED